MVTYRDLKTGKVKLIFGDPEQLKAIKEEEERIKNGCPTKIKEECEMCEGTGEIECEACNGDGVLPCECQEE